MHRRIGRTRDGNKGWYRRHVKCWRAGVLAYLKEQSRGRQEVPNRS